jgi:hypothetical protein
MKKQDITYQDKLNELRLDISHPNNVGTVFVLLEGESDIRLFRKLFNLDNCKVESIPGGNSKLEECVGELVNIYSLIIGIRDADFIHLNKQGYSQKNMFLTDLHDIEMTIISEDSVFSALIFESTLIPKEEHSQLRNKIITTVEQICLLKWLNNLENLELNFEAGFADLISFVNLSIDFNQYFSRVLSKSPNAKITDLSTIILKIDTLKKSGPDPFQLCCGHDFVKAISQFIRAQGVTKSINDEIVSGALRMTYTLDHFRKTDLQNNLLKWADLNSCIIFN